MSRLLLFCFGLQIISCSGLVAVKDTQTTLQLSQSDFLKKQELRQQELVSVRGKMRLKYEVGQRAISGEARFLKDKNKSRLEVSDPMGRVHYWLIGDSLGTLAFYDAEKTAYQSGKEGRTYFRKFFGINLSWTELENLWMGILPPAWRAQLTGDWTSKEGSFEGKIRNDKELINFQVSEKNGELQQVLWRTENKLIEILFTDFDACCSREGVQTQLGHSVSIKLPSRSDKIELEWEELNLLVEEPNPLGFSRKISARIKRVDLEE